jgi:hypothetical protein
MILHIIVIIFNILHHFAFHFFSIEFESNFTFFIILLLSLVMWSNIDLKFANKKLYILYKKTKDKNNSFCFGKGWQQVSKLLQKMEF